MSNVKYAAQVIVISIVSNIMCPPTIFATWRNTHEMCGAVLLRAVQTDSLLKLFRFSERMRAITQGEVEWDLPSDDIFNYAVWKIFVLEENFAEHMN